MDGRKRCKKARLSREGRFRGALQGEYYVGRIVDQNNCDDGAIEYLVEWAGYEHPEEHTWEPAATAEGTDALDVWFAANHPEALID